MMKMTITIEGVGKECLTREQVELLELKRIQEHLLKEANAMFCAAELKEFDVYEDDICDIIECSMCISITQNDNIHNLIDKYVKKIGKYYSELMWIDVINVKLQTEESCYSVIGKEA